MALDDAMFAAGSDSAEVMALLLKKEPLEVQVAGLYEEWEEVEILLAEFPDLA